MPKVFLVKRRSPGVSVRSWDELPDEERADTYIPGSAPPFAVGLGRLLCDPPEDCRSDGGSSSGGGSSSAGEPGGTESNSSTRTPERETLEPGDAEDPGGHLAAKQRPVARSKIKKIGCSSSCLHCNSLIILTAHLADQTPLELDTKGRLVSSASGTAMPDSWEDISQHRTEIQTGKKGSIVPRFLWNDSSLLGWSSLGLLMLLQSDDSSPQAHAATRQFTAVTCVASASAYSVCSTGTSSATTR
ncbi:transcription factor Ovo-like 2 isoform X3 [Myotis daubentonii]|uniref:transcription factor Ovo-like 2 isoform X3 n=1 Tax=Myotis daubentonii TaxID=98922 RepID=UPI002873AC71|nr:transcription factor Ovo-like 2 isoform X3 [Myotis daubentonii]